MVDVKDSPFAMLLGSCFILFFFWGGGVVCETMFWVKWVSLCEYIFRGESKIGHQTPNLTESKNDQNSWQQELDNSLED